MNIFHTVKELWPKYIFRTYGRAGGRIGVKLEGVVGVGVGGGGGGGGWQNNVILENAK